MEIDMPAHLTSNHAADGHGGHTFTPLAVLTPRQFYESILGVIGLNTIYELLRANRIRHVKVGSRYLILASEATEFFERTAEAGWAA
jgi:excisionase family DNA binding protein